MAADPNDAAGMAALGQSYDFGLLNRLPIDTPRALLIDTINKLIEGQNVGIMRRLYPIGSLYFNSDDSRNPAELLGFGTWAAFGAGRVPVGFDSTQIEFDTLEELGGEKTHVLTSAEMPAHTHGQNVTANPGTGSILRADFVGDVGTYSSYPQGVNTTSTGGGGAHNNLQPYIVVCIWKRTG